METGEFRKHAHQFVDWMADYMDNVTEYPVKSQVKPGDIKSLIPDSIPQNGEEMEEIFSDFREKIIPGITHWQSPNFYAYFQANASPPSILAEMLMSTLAIQGMKWETSPASTELEEKVMTWLMKAMNFPEGWSGVIQDTASTATLAEMISARERFTKFKINQEGFNDKTQFRII